MPVAALVALVGAAFACWGLVEVVRWALRRRWPVVAGEVVGTWWGPDQEHHYAQVRYVDADGRAREFWNSWSGVPRTSGPVRVRVHPRRPGRAVLDEGGASGCAFGGVALVAGSLIAVVGLAVATFSR